MALWRLHGDGEDCYRTLEGGRIPGTVYLHPREGDRLMRSAGPPVEIRNESV